VPIKDWEIIADSLSKAGWSLGWVSAIDSSGRTIWVADALAATESGSLCAQMKILTAFMELESAIRTCGDFFLTSWRRFLQTQCR
jgi:hypothetical protein